MKIRKNNKMAGRLLIASGIMFFIASSLARQPAFIGVGVALVTIGFVLFIKRA